MILLLLLRPQKKLIRINFKCKEDFLSLQILLISQIE